MKSGSFWTSAINSWMRVVVAFIVAIWLSARRRDAAAMGDDCVEDVGGVEEPVAQNLTKAYAEMGIRLKVVEVGNEFEFCSYRFNLSAGTQEPARPWRLAANFFYHWPPLEGFVDRVADLSWELRHSSKKTAVITLVEQVNDRLKAQGWYGGHTKESPIV